MASKKDLLKSSARSTGKGLFQGMTPIKEAKVQEEKRAEEAKKTIAEKAAPDAINETVETVLQQPETDKQPQPQEQPMVQEIYTQPVQPQVVPQPVQYTQPAQQVQTITPVQEVPVQQVTPVPVQTPAQTPVQAPVQPEIMPEPQVQASTTKSAKTGSRYEKEKFLLLDIRGLRDYVEHMAKASNMSATKYIRNLIEIDMRQNMDIYEAHKRLEEQLRGRR